LNEAVNEKWLNGYVRGALKTMPQFDHCDVAGKQLIKPYPYFWLQNVLGIKQDND
jgi:hypothetical protein